MPHMGSGVVGIGTGPIPGWSCKRHTKPDLSLLLPTAGFCICLFCLGCTWCFVCLFLVVTISAIDCLERLISKMTCYVSSGTLNPIYWLTQSWCYSAAVGDWSDGEWAILSHNNCRVSWSRHTSVSAWQRQGSCYCLSHHWRHRFNWWLPTLLKLSCSLACIYLV